MLYRVLDSLPITETDLETSGGLGLYGRCQLYEHGGRDGGEQEVPRLASSQKWMRPILGLKSTYKHLADVERQRALEIQKRSASLAPKRLPVHEHGAGAHPRAG